MRTLTTNSETKFALPVVRLCARAQIFTFFFLENPNTPERCAVIYGTPAQIERVTNMLWDLVSTVERQFASRSLPYARSGQ